MHVVIDTQCEIIPEDIALLHSEGSALLNFLSCLGYASSNPPLADMLRQFYQLDGYWLILSPIHWQASHNDAFITAFGKDLGLEDMEAKTWFDLFARHLAEEEMSLHYHDSGVWLLSAPQHPALHARPVHHLLNKSFMPALAELDNSLYWQKFITECQMFFAMHGGNSAVNGLWPWGNASLGEKIGMSVCADEHFLAMAKIASSDVSLYTPAVSLREYALLLVHDLSVLSPEHQKELHQISTDWYWNNTAYTSNRGNWIARFWRKLIHAH